MRTSRRSVVMLGIAGVMALMAFCWPLLISPGAALQGNSLTPLVFALILPVVLGVVVSELGQHDLEVSSLAMLGVLSAVGAAVRPLGAGTAGIETVFFLVILAGRVFGPGFGFVLGNTTLFTSALLTSGVGPWLPYQMLAAGSVGLGAGLLPRARGWLEVGMLAAYGAVAAFIFGALMDLAFWPFALGGESQLSFDPDAGALTNLHHFALYNLATSLGWNLGRALTNVALLLLLAPPLLRVLRRAARRGNLRPAQLDS